MAMLLLAVGPLVSDNAAAPSVAGGRPGLPGDSTGYGGSDPLGECGAPPGDDDDGGGDPGPGPGPGPGPDPVPTGGGSRTSYEIPGYMETESDYRYDQVTGTYIFPKSEPDEVEVRDATGDTLVTRATFELDSEPATTVNSSRILSANSTEILVESVVLSNSWEAGTLLVSYAFEGNREPKVTITFTPSGSPSLQWFRILWKIHTVDEYVSANGSEPLYFGNLQNPVLVTTSQGDAQVGNESARDEWSREVAFNWTDAGTAELWAGPISIATSEPAPGVYLRFAVGVSQIDPTLVARTTSAFSSGHSTQRKLFYQDGYYWLFYHDGERIAYRRTSGPTSELTAWSPAITVTEDYVQDDVGWFDVAQSGRHVVVAWAYTTANIASYAQVRVLSGSIAPEGVDWVDGGQWSDGIVWQGDARAEIEIQSFDRFLAPISAAIGSDGTEWIAAAVRFMNGTAWIMVYRALLGFATFFLSAQFQLPLATLRHAVQVVALLDGKAALLYVTEGQYDMWWALYTGQWTRPLPWDVQFNGDWGYGWPNNHPEWFFSAVGDDRDIIHVAYRGRTYAPYFLGYARLTPSGPDAWEAVLDVSTAMFPSISADQGGGVYIAFVPAAGNFHEIRVARNPTGSLGGWMTADVAFAAPDYVIGHVTLPRKSLWRLAVAWTSISPRASPPTVATGLWFGTLPIVAPSSSEFRVPWERDGLTPYGYFFTRLGHSVSPATGQLVLRQVDYAVPSRMLDLELARLYRPPRYLVNGQPFMYEEPGWYDVGDSWTYDLPWMGTYSFHWWGGQEFPYAFDADGVFELHEGGVHFRMAKLPDESFELRDAGGTRYLFESLPGVPSRAPLKSITDLNGNAISLTYAGGLLVWINDPTGHRKLELARTAGKVTRVYLVRDTVYQPVLDYEYVGEELGAVTFRSSLYHVTRYAYVYTDRAATVTSTRPYIQEITLPTGGRIRYEYVAIAQSTEAFSLYVALQEVIDTPAGQGEDRLSETTFHYTTVDGRAAYTDVYEYDDTTLRLHTSYAFGTPRRPLVVTRYHDPSGTVLREVRNWHAPTGEVSVQEVFLAGATTPTTTVETAVDEWGNLVYQRDSAGKETVATFANTKRQNAFRIPGKLRSAAGSREPVLYDDFSDRVADGWDVLGTVELDYAKFVDVPPALRVESVPQGSGEALRSFPSPTSTVYEYAVRWATGENPDFTLMDLSDASGTPIVSFLLSNRALYGLDSQDGWVVLSAAIEPEAWYTLGVLVNHESDEYTVWLNGRVLAGLEGPHRALRISSTVGTAARFLAHVGDDPSQPTPRMLWVQSVLVSDGTGVWIDGVPAGHWVTAVDFHGFVLGAMRSGGSLFVLPGAAPLVTVAVQGPDGTLEFQSPVRWFFPGHRMTYEEPRDLGPLTRTETGFGVVRDWLLSEDTDIPMGWNEGDPEWDWTEVTPETWVWMYGGPGSTSPPGAVHGDDYHASAAVPGAHRHQFAYIPYVTPATGEYVVQYFHPTVLSAEVAFRIKMQEEWSGVRWGDDLIEPDRGLHASMGPKLPERGRWNLLLARCGELGACDRPIRGWSYDLYGGAGFWDLSGVASADSGHLRVTGVPAGYTVRFLDETGQELASDVSDEIPGGTLAALQLYDVLPGVRYQGTVFPIRGYLRIEDLTGILVYMSALLEPIWGGDVYAYAGSQYYANEDLDASVHNRASGVRTWRDETLTSDEATVYFKYDAQAQLVESKTPEPGGIPGFDWITEAFGYDQYGHMDYRRDPEGRSVEYAFSDGEDGCWGAYLTLTTRLLDGTPIQTKYAWDCTWGGLTRSWTPRNIATDNPTDYSYDSLGRVTTVRHPSVEGIRDEYSVTYEEAQNSVLTTDEDGRRTRTRFNGIGQTIRVDRLQGSGTVHSFQLYDYDEGGNVRLFVDFDEGVTETVRDPLGRVDRVILPSGESVHYEYYDSERRIRVVNPAGVVQDKFFDPAGRLVEVREFPDELHSISTTYEYDASGNLLGMTDPNLRSTTHTYDALNRLIQTDYPDDKWEEFEYHEDGALWMLTRRDGQTLVDNYDGIGRLDTVKLNGATLLDYAYDMNDNVIGLTRSGAGLSYGYDARDRLTSKGLSIPGGGTYTASIRYWGSGSINYVDYPDGFRTSYSYDSQGRVDSASWVKDTLSDSVSISRDLSDRITKVEHGSGPTALQVVHRYDDAGRVRAIEALQGISDIRTEVLRPNGDKQIGWLQCPAAGAHFEKVDEGPDYDLDTFIYTDQSPPEEFHIGDMGTLAPDEAILWVEVSAVARVATTQSGYAAKLQFILNGWVFPEGYEGYTLTSDYTRYSRRFEKTPGPDPQPWTEESVDAATAGVRSVNPDNAQVRVTQLHVTVTIGKAATTYFLRLAFDYQANGKVHRIADVARGTEETYVYDGAGRLRDVNGRWEISYTYDAAGNRQYMTEGSATTSYEYGAYNQLSNYGPAGGPQTTLLYSELGNVRTRTEPGGPTWGFNYDSLGDMTSVTRDGDTVASYVFDGKGDRVAVDADGVRRESFSLDDAPIYEKVPATGWDRYHVYIDGLEVATVGTDGTSFPVADILGSVRLVLGYDAGAYIPEYEAAWKPFGIEVPLSGDWTHKYVGEEAPNAAGLYHFGARFYDPNVGRFYGLDPILGTLGTTQSLNGYAYARNDPVTLADPSGLLPRCDASTYKWGDACEVVNPFLGGLTQSDIGQPDFWRGMDVIMMILGFIPIVGDIASTAYFLYRDYQDCQTRGCDWVAISLDLVGIAPFVPNLGGAARIARGAAHGLNHGASLAVAGLAMTRRSDHALDLLRGVAPDIHHIATNKNSIRGERWTLRFEGLFKKAGMTLEDAANKISLPGHSGTWHSPAYHRSVYVRLSGAIDGLNGPEAAAALRAGLGRIANDLLRDPSYLSRGLP